MSKTTIRNLIIAIVLNLVATAGFGLMVYYVSEQGTKLSNQISVLEAERQQEAAYIKSQRLAEETISERNLLQSYFLEKAGDSIDFLNQVEDLAPQVGISLETKGLESFTDKTDGSEWIKVDFVFSGSKNNVNKFINILENFPYVSRLNEISLVSKNGTQWEATVKMQVRVLAYDK